MSGDRETVPPEPTDDLEELLVRNALPVSPDLDDAVSDAARPGPAAPRPIRPWPQWAITALSALTLGSLFLAVFGLTIAGSIVAVVAILTAKLVADPDGISWRFATFAVLAVLAAALAGQNWRERSDEAALLRYGYEWAEANAGVGAPCPSRPAPFRDGCYRWIDEQDWGE